MHLQLRVGLALIAAASLVTTSVVVGQHINGAGVATAGTRPADAQVIVNQPVEHRRAWGVGQHPAFPAQTRAPAVETKTPLEIRVIASGLRFPWALAFLPDGNILITEKPGAMRIVTPDGKVGDPIAGVPTVLFQQDAGLMDVTLDPHFVDNRMIYFAYVEPRGDDNGGIIAKARLSDDAKRLENVTTIYTHPTMPRTAHYGSRLLFNNDGTLFVTFGERYFSPAREQAQDLNSSMGKIIRINTDGTAAKGNPFEHTPGALPEIWSYGHRNPQGLAFNPVSGELWSSEHGAQGGDEINIILPGKNYGWPIVGYGTNYDGTSIGDGTAHHEGIEEPVYYWDPAIAPSGCTFYTGDLIPEWKNNLFVAGLAGQHVARLVIDGHKIVGEERLLLDQHQRMRDVQQGPDGALWVISDDGDGRLIRISASH
jgi:glucose/arabinose dehydrogenase